MAKPSHPFTFFKGSRLSTLAIASTVAAAMMLSACTNPTSRAGNVSRFSEGVITDIEYITIDLGHYDTQKSAGLGAVAGAALGNIIGKDSTATLIGAGIGALIGGGGATVMDRTSDGARLTVQTSGGALLVDQPYSCYFRKGARVRIINQHSGEATVQVEYNGSFRTAEKNSYKECPL